MLIGCGLRRGELLALTLESIQQREEHWVIADLVGKGGHVRTVPIPRWVKSAIDAWTAAAAITEGPVFRAINKAGRIWGDGMSPKVLWDVVRAAAAQAGIEKLAPPICGAPARGCVTWRAVNSSRSSSFWAMSPFRRRSAISDANRTSGAP
jgi:integrase